MPSSRSAADWYLHAERAYGELHQGCAWCGESHSVRRSQHGSRHTFYCQRCDFQISFDVQADRYQIIPGEKISASSVTMIGHPVADLLSAFKRRESA